MAVILSRFMGEIVDLSIAVEITGNSAAVLGGGRLVTCCYAEINGTRYNPPATGIVVMPGDTITFAVIGTNYTRGTVMIDGDEVLSTSSTKFRTYIWTVPRAIKNISIAMSTRKDETGIGYIKVTTS